MSEIPHPEYLAGIEGEPLEIDGVPLSSAEKQASTLVESYYAANTDAERAEIAKTAKTLSLLPNLSLLTRQDALELLSRIEIGDNHEN